LLRRHAVRPLCPYWLDPPGKVASRQSPRRGNFSESSLQHVKPAGPAIEQAALDDQSAEEDAEGALASTAAKPQVILELHSRQIEFDSP
jgi:hypothetical protein